MSVQPDTYIAQFAEAVRAQAPNASIQMQNVKGGVACTIGVNAAFTSMAAETLIIVGDSQGFTLSLEENLVAAGEPVTVPLSKGYEGLTAAAQELTGFAAGPQ